jgi:hypothetical protein
MPEGMRYAELSQEDLEYLEAARGSVDSMRRHLVAGDLLEPAASAAFFARAAIACDACRVQEMRGQQEALGVALGDELNRRLGWSWMRVTDPWGDETLAVVAPRVRAQAFALDWISKRVEGDGDFEDLPAWFERLVEVCAENVKQAGPR